MLLILHFQRAEVDRHFGVCPNRTLSLSCPYTSGKFVDETDVVSVESLYWFYFKNVCSVQFSTSPCLSFMESSSTWEWLH